MWAQGTPDAGDYRSFLAELHGDCLGGSLNPNELAATLKVPKVQYKCHQGFPEVQLKCHQGSPKVKYKFTKAPNSSPFFIPLSPPRLGLPKGRTRRGHAD